MCDFKLVSYESVVEVSVGELGVCFFLGLGCCSNKLNCLIKLLFDIMEEELVFYMFYFNFLVLLMCFLCCLLK